MSFSRLVSRWQGLALSLVGVVATVWLGFAGQLGLYIHPRYYVFTLVMAAIAVVLIVGAFAVVPSEGDEHDHGPGGHDHGAGQGHDHGAGQDHDHTRAGRTRRLRMIATTAASLVVVAAAVTALLVVPPATLTSATVEQRSINNASATLPGAGSAAAASTTDDTSAYTVKNWSLLMRQGTGLEYFDGRAATVTGFVTPDADDPDNVFFVARFVVTCCAVDAQPVGVAVYQPGWQSSYPVDSWVTVAGTFGADPSVLSTATIVLQPDSITGIPQPSDPYVY